MLVAVSKDAADFYAPGCSIESSVLIPRHVKTLSRKSDSDSHALMPMHSMQEARNCRQCFSCCGRTQPQCPSSVNTGSSTFPAWSSSQEDAGRSQQAIMPGGTHCQRHPATGSLGWTESFSSLAGRRHPFSKKSNVGCSHLYTIIQNHFCLLVAPASMNLSTTTAPSRTVVIRISSA